MLTKLDRYILGKFLGTFFFSITLIIGIAVIFDYSEKVDDFMENDAPMKAVLFQYYLNFIPYYANLFSYLFIFIAVILFTSKMASNTEIVAILASGVSFRRFLRPYFIGATILGILSFIMSSYIIPPATKVRLDFEEVYYRGRSARFKQQDFHKQTRPGEFIYLESYNTTVDIGYKFSLENYDKEGRLVRRLLSDHIRWNADSARWTVYDYYVRVILPHDSVSNVAQSDTTGLLATTSSVGLVLNDSIVNDSVANDQFTAQKELIYSGYKMDTVINIEPSEFKRRQSFVETMNIHELDDYLQESIIAGVPTEGILVEKYKRYAAPFAAFILTLIGASVACRKNRRGTGVYIALGLGLSFVYILFQQISAQFGIKGGLHPLLAVWIPNIIFSVIAVYLYRKAPK